MSSTARRIDIIHRHLSGTQSTQAMAYSNYRYTVDAKFLTEEERQFYETNGYVVCKKSVLLEDIETYCDRFKEVCSGNARIPGLMVVKDITLSKAGAEERTINKIQDFQHDEVFFKYCIEPEILNVVESIIGPNIMAMHTMLINKPPDTGSLTSRHPMHQDLHYFPFRPTDRIVCSWTAMETVNRDNGCLQVVPGSHKRPGVLLDHGYPEWNGKVNKMYHGIVGYDVAAGDRIYLEMDTGDTVFFHPLLIHGSGSNRTKGFRKAISCHYAASECDYIDVQGTTQENVSNEVVELARKKLGNDVNIEFNTVWKLRSRLARGKEINL